MTSTAGTTSGLSWPLAATLVVALALALRVASIGYGLDLADPLRAIHNAQVDERGMVEEELQLMRGDWHPGTFLMRGTAPFYIAGLADAAVLGSVALARGESWDATVARYESNPSLVFLVHRSLAVLAGVLTVVVVMRACRRELGASYALAAGLFLACAHLHVHMSHVGVVDVPWVLFAVLALARALRLARAPERAHYLLAGAWVGLAGATKYPGALIALSVLGAHLWARQRARRSGGAPPRWRLLAASALVSVATFLAFSPRLLWSPGEYLAAIRMQDANVDIGGASFGYVGYRHLQSLAIGLGEPVVLLAGIGIVAALWRKGAERRVALLALGLAPTAFVASVPAPRFATGLLVLAAILAAIGFVAMLARAPRWLQGAAAALAVAPALARSVATDLVLSRPDTRPQMLAELAARDLAPEDVLGIGHRGLPQLMGRPEPYVVLGREILRGRMRPRDVLDDPPPYILRDLTGGPDKDALIWEPLRDFVEEEYEEIVRIDGRRHPDAAVRPMHEYLILRTFVPFATPWDMIRPGPGLALYRRRTGDRLE